MAMTPEAVRTIVQEEIARALDPSGGVIATAIAFPDPAVTAQIVSLTDRVTQLEKIETEMETAAPFLAYERKCSPEELLFAWKKILVDQDVMANLADQMGDSAATNVMAAWCTNKTDPDLIRLKEAVALKNAPRTSWKMLCLSSHGGGPEKFRGFLADKVEDSDRTVACIARRCLAFYTVMERQFTSLRSAKKGSASKIEAQRDELMSLVYHAIKHMKLQARKAAARNSSDIALMNLVFAPDIAIASAKCFLGSSQVNADTSDSFSFSAPSRGEPSRKRARRSPSPRPSPRSSGKPAVSVDSLLSKIVNMARNKPQKEIHTYVEFLSHSPDPATASAMVTLKRTYCRNCLVANRGALKHGASECQAAGNQPSGPCKKCEKAGKKNEFHWFSQCTL
jgi:hypothetical protein